MRITRGVTALVLAAAATVAGATPAQASPWVGGVGFTATTSGTTVLSASCVADGPGTFSGGYTVVVAGEVVSNNGLAAFVDCWLYDFLAPIGARELTVVSGSSPGPAATAFGVRSVPGSVRLGMVCVRAAVLNPVTRTFVYSTDCPYDVG